jgi:hypothetical protein
MQPVLHNLRRFRALPAAERRTLVAAATLLPPLRFALRIVGLQRMQRGIARKPLPQAAPLSLQEAQRLGSLVNSASHHSLGPANCLTRSVYLWWLLRRRGVDCQLRIGVRRVQGRLDGHAWVEFAGIPINDRPDVSADFAAFDRPISPRDFSSP